MDYVELLAGLNLLILFMTAKALNHFQQKKNSQTLYLESHFIALHPD